MELDDLISRIAKRPNLFFRSNDLFLLRAYISGFLFQKDMSETILPYEKDFSVSFSRFVFDKTYRNSEDIDFVSWDTLLDQHVNGWDLFFTLYTSYRSN